MSKALLSSFRTAVLLTLFFNLVCFLVFLSRALRRCRSPANIFSTLTKNGRRLAELLFFSVLIADSIQLKQSRSAFNSRLTDIDSLSGIDSTSGVDTSFSDTVISSSSSLSTIVSFSFSSYSSSFNSPSSTS